MFEAVRNNNMRINTTQCPYCLRAVSRVCTQYTQEQKRRVSINRKSSAEEIDNRLFQHRSTLAFNFQMITTLRIL